MKDSGVNLVDESYELIKGMIYSYRIAPSSPVSDFVLSKKLNISRTPIRQAIMRLVSDGLVDSTPSGFRVTEISEDSINQLYDARRYIEGGILDLLMKNGISEEMASRIRSVINAERELLDSGKKAEALECDIEMHKLLSDACDNRFLNDAFRRIYMQMRLINVLSLANINVKAAEENMKLLDYIIAKDISNAACYLDQMMEQGRRQKLSAISRFGDMGIEGAFNFIASYFARTDN